MKEQDEGRVATHIHTYFTALPLQCLSCTIRGRKKLLFWRYLKRGLKKALFSGRSPLLTRASLTDEGGKSPARTEVGLVLRYDVLSVLAAPLPLVVRATGEGACPLPHPSSRRPPRLCLLESEWRSAQLHNAAQTPTGWLTDWRCCAPWNRDSDWARRHPPAGSQSLIPIPIHDHPNEALELETRAFGSGWHVPIHALEWGMPFR